MSEVINEKCFQNGDLNYIIAPASMAHLVERGSLSCKVKGCWFDSQSGNMLELQAGPQLGHMQEATY